jgi:hypothetical protein
VSVSVSIPPATAGADETPVMPAVASGVPVVFVDPAATWLPAVGAVPGGQHLRAAAIARVLLRYDDDAAGVMHDEEYEAVISPLPQLPTVTAPIAVDYDDRDLVPSPGSGVVYGLVAGDIGKKPYWTALQKSLVDHLVRTKSEQVWVNKTLKTYSRVGETQEEFVARCQVIAGEKADQEMTALRTKYAAKLDQARLKVTDAQIAAQSAQQAYDSEFGFVGMATTALGGLLGGRRSRSSISAQARRESTASAKVGSTAAKADAAARAYADLEAQLQADVVALDDEWKAKAAQVETKAIPLEKADVAVTDFRLVWLPVA